MPDPIAALQRALATHLNAALPAHLAAAGFEVTSELAQRVQDGWVEPEQEILEPDGTSDPLNSVVTITAPTPGENRPRAPQAASVTDIGGGPPQADVEVLWNVGTFELPLQVDVWAKSRSERESLVGAIRTALRTSVPDGAQLFLTLTEYHNAKASYRLDGTGMHSDVGSLVGGAWWRYTVTVTAECPELIKATAAKLKQLTLRLFIPPEATTSEDTQIFP